MQNGSFRKPTNKFYLFSTADFNKQLFPKIGWHFLNHDLLLFSFELKLNLPDQLEEIVDAIADGASYLFELHEVIKGNDIFLVESTSFSESVNNLNENLPHIRGQHHEKHHHKDSVELS